MQLPGHVDVIDIARPAARLVRRVHLGDALADQRFLCHDLICRAHAVFPYLTGSPASAMASTILR